MRIVNIDLDEDFLKRFFDLTGDKLPESITLVSLKKQVLNIKERFRSILADTSGASAVTGNNIDSTEDEKLDLSRANNVLLVDKSDTVSKFRNVIKANDEQINALVAVRKLFFREYIDFLAISPSIPKILEKIINFFIFLTFVSSL